MKSYARLYPLFLAVLAGTAPALAVAQTLRATQPELAERSAHLSGGQLVALTDELVPKLLAAPFDKPLWVTDWPLAPEVFQEVVLTRREVYAPDAHIYKIGPEGKVEVPRSRLAFFGGGSTDGKAGVWLSIDPQTGELDGSAEVLGEVYALRRAADGRYAVAKAEAFAPEGLKPSQFGCGTTSHDLAGSAFLAPPPTSSLFPSKTLATLHTATVAVDTDNELMQLKFSDNTTSATNYVAQLITGMNVMYERDLNVRLLQGVTFLRISSQPDPYNQAAAGAADNNKLNEFASYWQTNNGSITRALAMMLSGKQPQPDPPFASASGIAFVTPTPLCSSSSGYSFSQVFPQPSLSASNDVKLVGHELGHNFGSPHTHCYSPPIDTCYNLEACYTGATSCPAPTTVNGVTNVQGTVMSYCHISPQGCTSSSVFHQRTLDLINPIITSKVGICVFPAGAGATASKFYTVPPCRLIDTRNANGALGGPALAASATRSFTVTGSCGIPADAKAVSGNITVVAPLAAGFLNAYATGNPTSTSLLNFRVGQVKANNVVLKLPTSGGSITFQNGSAGLANFVLDVNGYFK